MNGKNWKCRSMVILVALSAGAAGCAHQDAAAPAASVGAKQADDKKREPAVHEHGDGPHHGVVADWGGGEYHVEFTVDHDKQEATVYVLGGDERTLTPVAALDGKLLLSIAQPEFQVELHAVPMPQDGTGKSSRYVGRHEMLGVVQEFSGTIIGEIDGTPYTGEFAEQPHEVH